MNLTDQNLREKEFHNKLQSKSKGRFENIFYKAILNAWDDFYNFLNTNAKNSEILDYGCGVGPVIEKVIKFNPKKITGIDISNVSISKAREKFTNSKVELIVDNCENTSFSDNKFDIVYGLGILHHLKIPKCINEILRILKPNGTLLTPNSRSKDEHPLVFKDFEMIRSNFKSVNIKYYGFLTLVFFPFYNSNNSKIFKALVKLDQLLFKIKIFKYFAWSVLITAKKN